MKRILLFFIIIFSTTAIHAQEGTYWKKIAQNNGSVSDRSDIKSIAANQLLFNLNEVAIKKTLELLQNKTVAEGKIEITIPNMNGDLERFLVWESSNFEPELQTQFPNIRAYNGIGITDRNASLYFSLSPKGIQSMILRGDSGSEFIEPYSKDSTVYVLFRSKNRNKGSLPFTCKTEDIVLNKQLLNTTGKISANNKVFKTLRLALSCTGEYTAYHGGTVSLALAAMNATMTRVNGVFNKDLAIKLQIIANNNLIIYTNAATDPYSNATAGAGGSWNQELQDNLTNVITNGGYDIGHLFGASGGGGNAGCIGCVCVNPSTVKPLAKGSAFTSPSDAKPEGDTFDIDFVAHEMGHQLGANHTFSYEIEGTGISVEPGSGSTIMGYAGITSDYDVQASSDDYFAYASIKQIQDNLLSKTCPVSTVLTNNPPAISAGLDYTIPNGTAFILKGSGSDSNGDVITYCWEQNDSAITTSGVNSVAFPTKIDGPLFRSLYPSSSPIRYMPAYSTVLSNKLTTTWESVSTVARTLHFVLTGRDNAALGTAQTNTDEMIVTVNGTVGPFAVTSQNTENLSWVQGTNQTITWNVNGSNGLEGSASINIKLSTDGGLTFSTLLIANTPNDGSETITVPNITATNCRILIEPTANIYYAVNSKSFAIGYSVASSCATYTFATPVVIPDAIATYTTRTITVPTSTGSISDVNFAVSLTHSYLSDVQMEIVSPLGTKVKLFDRSCGSTNNALILDYDDLGGSLVCGSTTAQTVSPFEPLAAFNGQNPQGVWTFRVRDVDATKIGTVDQASITICTKTYTLGISDVEINDFVVYPNPNKGNFNIQFTNKSSAGVKVMVHDLLGRKLFENEFENKSIFNENIQLKNVQPGLYLLTVIDGNRKEVRKILIK
ncbi:zinc-dependent metalloprotease [Flavobacterium xueshanense]|uniref:Por secretion system C-terminal sorting domain-containing protein n=1 Tax=Flavobacterium xueshanense TaxID=935223 RepID=A0A1I2ASV7_9FLAO|nr:zinc-dependent metalloprotease family protein [Flavobacterium xueshanense]SFE47061.1 Por secretion system C-terminal sorting domain-containing protein [Flavobacterium xueshanense]